MQFRSLGQEDSPGEGNGNPLLENPMDGEAWRTTVHGVARVWHDLATESPPLQLPYNVVLVSAVQWTESVTCVHMSLPPLDLPSTPPSPPHSTRQGHHRTLGWAPWTPCAMQPLPTSSFTWSSAHMSILSPNSPQLPLHPLCPYVQSNTSVPLFLPWKYVHLYHFCRFHIYALICDTCFSFSDLLCSVWQILGPSTFPQTAQFCSF